MSGPIAQIFGLIAATIVGGHSPAQPNPALTPGAVLDTRAEVVCAPGYAKAHRVWHDKRSTAAKYGIPWSLAANMEDDDLVPIGLGGDNANPKNHWLQKCDAWRSIGHSGIRECSAGQAADKDKNIEHLWEGSFHRACRSGDMARAQAVLNAGQQYFLTGKWVQAMPAERGE